jgi:uncharacterized membrane protein
VALPFKPGRPCRQGTFTSFEYPGANFTVASAINPKGQIVGLQSQSTGLGPDFFAPGKTHGYLLSNGVFTPIDFPGAVFTAAIDINPEGAIVGRYITPEGIAPLSSAGL